MTAVGSGENLIDNKFLAPETDYCYQCTREFGDRGSGIVSVIDCETLKQGFEFCVIFPEEGTIITRLFGANSIAEALEITREEVIDMLTDRIERENLTPKLIELISISSLDFRQYRNTITDAAEVGELSSGLQNPVSSLSKSNTVGSPSNNTERKPTNSNYDGDHKIIDTMNLVSLRRQKASAFKRINSKAPTKNPDEEMEDAEGSEQMEGKSELKKAPTAKSEATDTLREAAESRSETPEEVDEEPYDKPDSRPDEDDPRVLMQALEAKRAQAIREHRQKKDQSMATYHTECKALYAVEREARAARLAAAKQEAFDQNTHYYRSIGEGLRRRKELAEKREKFIDRREEERDEHSRLAVIRSRVEANRAKEKQQDARGRRVSARAEDEEKMLAAKRQTVAKSDGQEIRRKKSITKMETRSSKMEDAYVKHIAKQKEALAIEAAEREARLQKRRDEINARPRRKFVAGSDGPADHASDRQILYETRLEETALRMRKELHIYSEPLGAVDINSLKSPSQSEVETKRSSRVSEREMKRDEDEARRANAARSAADAREGAARQRAAMEARQQEIAEKRARAEADQHSKPGRHQMDDLLARARASAKLGLDVIPPSEEEAAAAKLAAEKAAGEKAAAEAAEKAAAEQAAAEQAAAAALRREDLLKRSRVSNAALALLRREYQLEVRDEADELPDRSRVSNAALAALRREYLSDEKARPEATAELVPIAATDHAEQEPHLAQNLM